MEKIILSTIGLFLILEFYIYQAIKTSISNSYIKSAYIIFNIIVYLFSIYIFLTIHGSRNSDALKTQILATVFLGFIFPKIFIVIFLFIDDILRIFQFGVNYFTTEEKHLPERRKFLAILGMGLAGIFSALILDGVFFGKYRHRVRRVKLKIKNLPKSFKGYKIIQISDAHCGSFLNPEKLKPTFDLINQQNADLVVFTGDMVNNVATEFVPMQKFFASIKAKDGKFSVLGNHDYGEYVKWRNDKEKSENLKQLIELQENTGFKVLRNENQIIEKNGEQLCIIGVENWGLPPFPQYGDLDKATAGLSASTTKILLSHDPTHFDEIVKHHPANIALTLSGHTHGMQFGLDLKNIKWSPVQYRYKKWVDLYESNGKYLYVNRGFGVIGYPGRVGILPEITLFELS